MSIFKRKYKRSQWMEGLLWAENLKLNEGWRDNLIYSRVPGCTETIEGNFSLLASYFARGAWDCLNYYENKLKCT